MFHEQTTSLSKNIFMEYVKEGVKNSYGSVREKKKRVCMDFHFFVGIS